MPINPISGLTRLEALRRSGIPITPELLSDGLEGAATPITEDPAMADQEAMFQRQAGGIKTDDYRRERMMYRAAKATGTPVAELMQQPEWSGVGEARADDAVMPMQARAAMAQKRMDGEAERMDRWKSQMMLASSNSRANMSNAFEMLSPEQKQRVIESRLTGNRNSNNNDPRFAIAQLEAETRRAEGSDARASAAEIAEANRVAAREQRQAERNADELRYGAQREETRGQNAAVLKQGDDRLKLALKEMEAARDRDTGTRDLGMEKIRAEIAALTTNAATSASNNTANNASAERVAGIHAAASGGPAEIALARLKQDEDKRKDNMRAGFASNNVGAYHAAIGLQTPEADQYLKTAAAGADNFQFLPGGGFGNREAGSMNAALLALARQADMSGVPNRLNDRAYREELIRKYGYSSGWSGGRGGWLGDFWQPIPNDPPLAPQ